MPSDTDKAINAVMASSNNKVRQAVAVIIIHTIQRPRDSNQALAGITKMAVKIGSRSVMVVSATALLLARPGPFNASASTRLQARPMGNKFRLAMRVWSPRL